MKTKRNYKVDFFRYNDDTLELWLSVYFIDFPSPRWLSDIAKDYDSFSVSKVK